MLEAKVSNCDTFTNFSIQIFPVFVNKHMSMGLRKFTVGINGLEFTLDAQIKYLA